MGKIDYFYSIKLRRKKIKGVCSTSYLFRAIRGIKKGDVLSKDKGIDALGLHSKYSVEVEGRKATMNKKYKWIFFDLDGTLADSIPAMYQVYLDFLSKFDKKGTEEEFEELNGPSLSEIVSVLKARHGLADNEVFLINFYKEKILDAYRNIVIPMAGAGDVLEALKNRGYKLLLVTSAGQKIAIKFVKYQGWNKYFQGYVFGDEISQAKPAPEIYALALKKANASPDSVVIVEDSYNGIKSAKGTGAFVIGLVNNQTKAELAKAGANITIFHLKEILSILETKV